MQTLLEMHKTKGQRRISKQQQKEMLAMQEHIYTVASDNNKKPFWSIRSVETKQVRKDHLEVKDTFAQQLLNSRAQYVSL